MRLLLDTHVALWWVAGSDELSARAIEMLSNPANVNLFSVASAWEIATKCEIGRLKIPVSPAELLDRLTDELDLTILPIEISDALKSATLPWHHRDPFDRLLIAQALLQDVPILTSDKRIAKYSVPVLW
jgi:PIN domain nuclease of toxin-antitoxin system